LGSMGTWMKCIDTLLKIARLFSSAVVLASA
jgi:hypothetical protein